MFEKTGVNKFDRKNNFLVNKIARIKKNFKSGDWSFAA